MSKKLSIFMNVVYAILAIVLTYLVVIACKDMFAIQDIGTGIFILICVLAFALSFIFAIFIHELGHLVFGKKNNMEINGIKIWGLCFYKKQGKLKVCLSKNKQVAGYCELIPKRYNNIEHDYFWTTIGGSIFSGCYMTICLLVVLLGGNIGVWWLYLLVGLQLPFAFYQFAMNLTPMRIFDLKTDGLVALELKKREPTAIVACRNLTIQAMLYEGCMPSEIDRDIYFKTPQLPADDIQYGIITSLRCMYYYDSGVFEKCQKHLERLKNIYQEIPVIYAEEIASEICFYDCVFGDLSSAKEFYSVCEKYLQDNTNVTNIRILSAYKLYVEEEKEQAKTLIEQGLDLVNDYLITGLAKYETKLFKMLEKEITP